MKKKRKKGFGRNFLGNRQDNSYAPEKSNESFACGCSSSVCPTSCKHMAGKEQADGDQPRF